MTWRIPSQPLPIQRETGTKIQRATHCHSAQMLILDFEDDYTHDPLCCDRVIELDDNRWLVLR